jgi:single-strand DNA-binding protein
MDTIEACFVGRLGNDPERKTSQKGKPYARFNVAVGAGDAAQWVNVSCFDKVCDEIMASVKKGDRVYCEGRMKLNTWEDREGKPRSGLQLAAWRVSPLGQIGERKPKKSEWETDANWETGR